MGSIVGATCGSPVVVLGRRRPGGGSQPPQHLHPLHPHPAGAVPSPRGEGLLLLSDPQLWLGDRVLRPVSPASPAALPSLPLLSRLGAMPALE